MSSDEVKSSTTTEAAASTTTHIALIPSPGMGHIIPMFQLANLLTSHHNIQATFIIPSASNPPPANLLSLLEHSHPANSDYILLQSPISADNHSSTGVELTISHTLYMCLPSIKSTLKTMLNDPTRPKLSALIVDSFGLDTIDIAKELNLPIHMFFGTAAMNLLFFLHLPTINSQVPEKFSRFDDFPHPVQLPGCPPLHGRDFGDPFRDRSSAVFKTFLSMSRKAMRVDGIVINTFDGLESGAIKILRGESNQSSFPPVYPVGPLSGSKTEENSEQPVTPRLNGIIKWLDAQPPRSVLLVCFGSGGVLTHKQTTELALGLEVTGKRFLWGVKEPADSGSVRSYCGEDDHKKLKDPKLYLPDGFLVRVQDRALVVMDWVPQAIVLAHKSTGAFLTHCGWNSALESLVHGVPMIAWPLYAEQRTNAVVLTDELKVAIRPTSMADRFVEKEDVAQVVDEIFKDSERGGEVRKRAMEVKEVAAKVFEKERGSSARALDQLVDKWRKG